jgi:outer membrane protein TolC
MNSKNSVNLKFMNQNKFLVWIFFSLFLANVNAQIMSLTQVLEKIERDNPMLAGYKTRAEALNNYAEGARAWMAPMAGIGTFMTQYPSLSGKNKAAMADGDESDRGSLMISVEQTIPNKNKLDANRRYLGEKSKTEELKRNQQWNELRFQARQAYYTWSVAEEKLKELEQTAGIVKMMAETTVSRLAYNQSTPTAVYRAQARVAEIENMKLMTESLIQESKAALTTLMNLSEDVALGIEPVSLPLENLIIPDTTSLAQKRSDILGMDREIELMKLNRKLQSLQNKPDVRLRFDHMQSYGDMPDQFTAMAMFTIPVAPWSSKMYKSEIAGMTGEIQSMRQERSALLIETRGMINRMVLQIRNMKAQLGRYESAIIPALQRNYESLNIAWEENRETLPMVLDGLEALTMARLEYLEKKQSLYMMIAAYEKFIEE